MSTLQISLAIIGVIVLGLIVAYNSWNNRRHAPKRPDARAQDVGVDPRYEPSADGVDVTNLPPAVTAAAVAQDPLLHAVAPAADVLPEGHAAGLDDDPALHAAPAADRAAEGDDVAAAAPTKVEAEPKPPALQQSDRRLALDALIDAIATIRVEHSLPGDAVLQVQPTTRRAGSKAFRIEGLNDASQEWESVRAGQRYSQLQAGVQLANRLGPLNEIEYSEFVAKVHSFVDALPGASAELPDMLHEVGRARELDQFAGEHDAQLSFVLRPRRAAWSPGYITQHASQQGFVPAAMPGRMLLPSGTAGHAPLLLLNFDAQAAQSDNLDETALHEVWISLDVPQVPREEAPFARLRTVLLAMCESMEGIVCDQNGYQLSPHVFDPIAADLDKLYDMLASRELAAGSVLARRLFS